MLQRLAPRACIFGPSRGPCGPQVQHGPRGRSQMRNSLKVKLGEFDADGADFHPNPTAGRPFRRKVPKTKLGVETTVFSSRFVGVTFAQGPCLSSLCRSNFIG